MLPNDGHPAGVAIGWLVRSTDSDCRGCDEFRGIVLWYWLSVLSIAAVPVPVAWKVLKAQEKHAGSRVGQGWLARNRAQGLV